MWQIFGSAGQSYGWPPELNSFYHFMLCYVYLLKILLSSNDAQEQLLRRHEYFIHFLLKILHFSYDLSSMFPVFIMTVLYATFYFL